MRIDGMMMLGTACKILVLFQFALVAMVPCHCIAQRYATAETAAVDCCRGGSCQASLGRDAAAVDAPVDHKVCPQPHRRSACPGRLLPDLAPPPSAPGDDLPAVLKRDIAGWLIAIDASDHLSERPSTLTPRSRAAPRPGDESLLRQRCALII